MTAPVAARGATPADGLCAWCRLYQVNPSRAGVYCSRLCRQAAWRLRHRREVSFGPNEKGGLRFAYADPPYPGLAARYYRKEASFAGEVDHAALIASLTAAAYAGWALSTSGKALRDVLPLCPAGARVCAWVKPIGVPRATFGLHSRWEPLIVVGGRPLRGGVRDWLRAMPARGWGELPGRKPLAFCAWLFDALGMVPGDHLDDLFPGTGAVSRAWREVSARSLPTRRPLPALSDASPGDRGDVSATTSPDVSLLQDGRRAAVAGVR